MKAKESELKVIKSMNYSFLYLYFKHCGNTLRINTENKPIKGKMLKDNLYAASVPNYKELNAKTVLLKTKVDGYIKFKLNQYKGTINQKECINYITTSNYVTGVNYGELLRVNDFIPEQPKPEKTVLDFYDDFIAFKTNQISDATNYNALKTNLINFEISRGMILTFEYIATENFPVEFKKYLSSNKLNKHNNDYLSTNTVSIKLKQIITFLNWINKNDVYLIKPDNYKIKATINTNEALALSKNDIKELLNLKGLTESKQQAIDMFVCNCLLGLRFSDLQTLNFNNINKHNETEYFIQQTNKKTATTVIVEIQPTSLAILKKYNYHFKKMTNCNFNKIIKSTLVKYNLFSDLVTIQERYNSIITDVKVMRRSLVTSHTMRKSYINLCFNNETPIPLNTLMLSTGHKSIKSLQGYMAKKQNKDVFKGIDI